MNGDEINLEELDWNKILEALHTAYPEILAGTLAEYYPDNSEVMYDLLRSTHVEVQYDPALLEDEKTPQEQEETIFWSVLGREVTAVLRNIIAETHPEHQQFVDGFAVSTIGTHYAPWGNVLSFGSASCPGWQDCTECGATAKRRIYCYV